MGPVISRYSLCLPFLSFFLSNCADSSIKRQKSMIMPVFSVFFLYFTGRKTLIYCWSRAYSCLFTNGIICKYFFDYWKSINGLFYFSVSRDTGKLSVLSLLCDVKKGDPDLEITADSRQEGMRCLILTSFPDTSRQFFQLFNMFQHDLKVRYPQSPGVQNFKLSESFLIPVEEGFDCYHLPVNGVHI